MKKILFRKLLLDYLSFFFITLISTAIVIWVFQAVNFLDIMVEDGRDYLVYITYSLLNFPKILSKIFPFILFFNFSVLNRNLYSTETFRNPISEKSGIYNMTLFWQKVLPEGLRIVIYCQLTSKLLLLDP